MSIAQDAQDYYYNLTNGYSCWGGGSTTPQGFYEPSNYYMVNNATLIYNDLQAKGWAFNPIMAVLGNMCYESNLNPAQSEIGKDTSGSWGYGLCQWTPRRTTIQAYLENHGHPLTSGYYQLDYLDTGAQWIPKSAYGNMTWAQFKSSTMPVDYLTNCFLACYERGQQNQYRNDCAAYYETLFGGGTTGNHIYVTYNGNGEAYVIPVIVQDGDQFTLYAFPTSPDELLDITATTASGQSIAMVVEEEHTYTYESYYGLYINIEVTFSGETPPIPPSYRNKKLMGMPIWMYPVLRRIT